MFGFEGDAPGNVSYLDLRTHVGCSVEEDGSYDSEDAWMTSSEFRCSNLLHPGPTGCCSRLNYTEP